VNRFWYIDISLLIPSLRKKWIGLSLDKSMHGRRSSYRLAFFLFQSNRLRMGVALLARQIGVPPRRRCRTNPFHVSLLNRAIGEIH
jgi:hypothetical protein